MDLLGQLVAEPEPRPPHCDTNRDRVALDDRPLVPVSTGPDPHDLLVTSQKAPRVALRIAQERFSRARRYLGPPGKLILNTAFVLTGLIEGELGINPNRRKTPRRQGKGRGGLETRWAGILT